MKKLSSQSLNLNKPFFFFFLFFFFSLVWFVRSFVRLFVCLFVCFSVCTYPPLSLSLSHQTEQGHELNDIDLSTICQDYRIFYDNWRNHDMAKIKMQSDSIDACFRKLNLICYFFSSCPFRFILLLLLLIPPLAKNLTESRAQNH